MYVPTTTTTTVTRVLTEAAKELGREVLAETLKKVGEKLAKEAENVRNGTTCYGKTSSNKAGKRFSSKRY